jgi:hypothetical protein
VKIACNRADSKGAELGSDHIQELEEENEVDLSLLSEKERNKILNQRVRNAKKTTKKANKEAKKASDGALREANAVAEKKAKKAEKSRKSKAFIPPLLLIQTSIGSPIRNARKRDASFT